ncbi:hypothetical protein KRR38_27930 [Novosphingobium sp. G106]|nr:hypothetical protein [Novosphingobium sp. G106]
MMRTQAKETIMTVFQPIAQATDRVMAALVAGLEIEFGRGVSQALAQRFLAAEECDFLWDARVEERWIGAYDSSDDDEIDLDRVKILGRLDGDWFVALMIVDGEGRAHGMIAKRRFKQRRGAEAEFLDG